MIDLTYPALLEPLASFLAPKRNESASFLIWYLNNYYRLDEVDAVDSVCDQMGDKGVDGIYVNEGAGTIDVFQSKISQKAKSTIGDTQLKEFAGTLTQFSSKANLQKLLLMLLKVCSLTAVTFHHTLLQIQNQWKLL